jgi:hypothetical protein
MMVVLLQRFGVMYKQFIPLPGLLIQDYLLVAVKIQRSKSGVLRQKSSLKNCRDMLMKFMLLIGLPMVPEWRPVVKIKF